MIRGEKVRALAISSAQRNAAAPEIPTIAESGFPGFDVNPWWGFWRRPAPTCRSCARSTAMSKSVLRTQGDGRLPCRAGRRAAHRIAGEISSQMLQADIAKWAKVVKSANVSLD
jgi:tripartite-type tricarboxylate transporter receptor subunit TctC